MFLKDVLGENESLSNRNRTSPDNRTAFLRSINMDVPYPHLTRCKHALHVYEFTQRNILSKFSISIQFSNKQKSSDKVDWSQRYSSCHYSIQPPAVIIIMLFFFFFNIIQLSIARKREISSTALLKNQLFIVIISKPYSLQSTNPTQHFPSLIQPKVLPLLVHFYRQ